MPGQTARREISSSTDGLVLTPGLLVKTADGEEGYIQAIRILSTGVQVEEFKLDAEMEPVVLTLSGKGYTVKSTVRNPNEIELLAAAPETPSRAETDNPADLGDGEAFDNEAAFGEEGEDGNPLQDLLDGMTEAQEIDNERGFWF